MKFKSSNQRKAVMAKLRFSCVPTKLNRERLAKRIDDLNPPIKWNIKIMKEIVKKHQAKKVNGVIIDPTTANMVITVHNALNEKNKKRAMTLPISKFVEFGWKQVK